MDDRHCASCGDPLCTRAASPTREAAMGLCLDCASKVPGEAKACPSCGCPLVERMAEGSLGWLWSIKGLRDTVFDDYVHYCPEHGCDLEAEFHLALKAKKAGQHA